jgi:hypothetical protein
MYPLPARVARCAAAPFYLRSGFFVFGLTKGKRENPPASFCRSTLFRSKSTLKKQLKNFTRHVTSLTQMEAASPLCSRKQANVREASMPELSATEQPQQSNIVTWKVISIGTAIVLIVFLFLWF